MLSCVTLCLSFSLREEVPFMSLHPHNGFPGGSVVKNPPANAEAQETWVRSLGWEDSPGDGNGNPLQYSCLDNPLGHRSLVTYSPWGHKRVRHDRVNTHTHTHIMLVTILGEGEHSHHLHFTRVNTEAMTRWLGVAHQSLSQHFECCDNACPRRSHLPPVLRGRCPRPSLQVHLGAP